MATGLHLPLPVELLDVRGMGGAAHAADAPAGSAEALGMNPLFEMQVDRDEKPGVKFMLMRHDDGCPAIETQSTRDCTCNAVLETVEQERWIASVSQTRRERRQAEREAEKALRRARRRRA